jgi:hypothetical protein
MGDSEWHDFPPENLGAPEPASNAVASLNSLSREANKPLQPTVYRISRIYVVRMHTLNWLFSQEKAAFHGRKKVSVTVKL